MKLRYGKILLICAIEWIAGWEFFEWKKGNWITVAQYKLTNWMK